jgi:hypothetical protein
LLPSIAAKHPAPKDRLFATSRGLIQFCIGHPQQFRNVFFGPENRNGVRAGQYIDGLGRPLFERVYNRVVLCQSPVDVRKQQSEDWVCSTQ